MRRLIHIDARNEQNLSRHVRDSRRSIVDEIEDSLKEGSVISDGHVSIEDEPIIWFNRSLFFLSILHFNVRFVIQSEFDVANQMV